ncbi:efflux RND transporter permease subunit, partial [Burkholderia sp. SIMBA_013]
MDEIEEYVPGRPGCFVRRPVLALVVSTLLLLMGLRALSGLPIRQYPLTESTTITITTQYPGAS